MGKRQKGEKMIDFCIYGSLRLFGNRKHNGSFTIAITLVLETNLCSL